MNEVTGFEKSEESSIEVLRNSTRASASTGRSSRAIGTVSCDFNRHQLSVIRVSSSLCVLRRLASNLPASAPVNASLAPLTRNMEAENPHFLPKDQKVVALSVNSFDALPEQAKLYAHYLSKASWYGGLIVLHQTSPEAPLLFIALHRALTSQPLKELDAAVAQSGVSLEDYEAFKLYAAGFYSNMGNYKGFGDIKFIPRCSEESVEKILKASAAWKEDPDGMEKLWTTIKTPMFSLAKGTEFLGFKGKGVTTYFSSNCTEEDSELVKKYLTKKNIGPYINRVFKTDTDGKTEYEIRMASVKTDPFPEPIDEEFEGARFRVTRGDYSPLLKLVCEELRHASEHTATEHEKPMLLKYVESFEEGSLDAHYDGSRHWIKNKGPVIETYIGFIETYRDPAGVRGEFEGFVAMVNRDMSKRYAALVNNAEKFLAHMPWPKEFEKDTFLQPDFTSLDVLTFAGSGIPAGINIPNYDEIRQNEGFKNVSLGNVIYSSLKVKSDEVPFLDDDDSKLIEQLGPESFEITVGLHELLGHGSGKLLMRDASGSFNFDKDLTNPLTGKKVSGWYEPGESYDSKFGSLGSAYEECRAETAVLQLSHIPEVFEIFGCDANKAEQMKKTIWLSMVYSGFGKALESWQPASKRWLQAHSQARFVILRVLIEAGDGLISVKEVTGKDGKPDLVLKVDYDKIDSVGRPAIADFLRKLQVFKACGDFKAAREMFEKYSEVPEEGAWPFARWRDIMMARKKPRKIMVCPNTFLKDGKVSLKTYADTMDAVLESFAERLPISEELDVTKTVYEVWMRDSAHFPLVQTK